LTDETSDSDVYADMPLTFVHEQMNDVPSNAPEPAAPDPVDPNTAPPGAKKKWPERTFPPSAKKHGQAYLPLVVTTPVVRIGF
jgi:hypothetical protein